MSEKMDAERIPAGHRRVRNSEGHEVLPVRYELDPDRRRFIVDERVGCVAVYRAPKENCLADITRNPRCCFYRGGKWKQARDGRMRWTVAWHSRILARAVCTIQNWRFRYIGD